ncbi:MAG: ABC transporter ATP-binding protein [Phycisphaerae bacterium]
MTLLDVRDLRTYFRTTGEPRKVVDGISLAIESGETLGLVGESGCGKSLTALSIMQLVPRPGYVAGGSVVFKGRDIVKMPGRDRRAVRGRHIGMIFQEPMTSLNPVLTVRTQLLEAVRRSRPDTDRDSPGARISKAEATDRAVEALRLAEMPDPARHLRQYPHQLSGGMRQRVMIAMALACRPDLLIADEPTTALDVTVEARILDLLRGLQEKLGTAILFITHDLAVISEMAHRVVVMYAGKIVETAPAAVLFDRPCHPYTERLLRCRPTRTRRGRPLETIKGIVPSPRDYAPGCRFCDRCPRVFEPCHDTEPPLREMSAGHAVACHLYEDRTRSVISAVPSEAREEVEAASPSDGLLLDARGVVKYFPIRRGVLQRVVGNVRAVDGVDLAIRRGSTVALVGESGCGKTTLGKTLIRLLPPTGGEVRFDGKDLMTLGEGEMRAFRRDAQVVFQDPYSSLNPRMTVREIVEEGLRVHGIGTGRSDRIERIRKLLADVGLETDAMGAYPHEFSGGQRQRIGIARALAVEPRFIVLDEPTSSLDVSIQAQILNLLRRLQDRGRQRLTYLFITHDLGVVEYVADEVAVMYLGRIVEKSPTEALFDDSRHPYTRALLSAIPRIERAGRAGHVPLEGDVPSPSNPPPGCHFHPRCPRAMDICRKTYPPITELEAGRTVRCHLHGERIGESIEP